ncbi:MAG: hypothetical protein ACFFBT_13420, partial [Promethearchaeota archaeon]
YRRFKFFKKKIGAFTVSENKLIRKIISNNFKKIDTLEDKIRKLENLLKELQENMILERQLISESKNIKS